MTVNFLIQRFKQNWNCTGSLFCGYITAQLSCCSWCSKIAFTMSPVVTGEFLQVAYFCLQHLTFGDKGAVSLNEVFLLLLLQPRLVIFLTTLAQNLRFSECYNPL